jgi:hypothetical protein
MMGSCGGLCVGLVSLQIASRGLRQRARSSRGRSRRLGVLDRLQAELVLQPLSLIVQTKHVFFFLEYTKDLCILVIKKESLNIHTTLL